MRFFVQPFLLLALISSVCADAPNRNVRFGAPASPSVDRNTVTITRPEYVLSYSSKTCAPVWVAWNLTKADIGNVARGQFEADPDVPESFPRVTPACYRNSGFDIGHMCPSQDRSNTRRANDATFLMSNVIPQAPIANEITWKGMESFCRSLAKEGHDLYIVCGPHGTKGEGDTGFSSKIVHSGVSVTVPASMWKIVYVHSRPPKTFAAIVPNRQRVDHDWRIYEVEPSKVEALTGLQFFPRLPKKETNAP